MGVCTYLCSPLCMCVLDIDNLKQVFCCLVFLYIWLDPISVIQIWLHGLLHRHKLTVMYPGCVFQLSLQNLQEQLLLWWHWGDCMNCCDKEQTLYDMFVCATRQDDLKLQDFCLISFRKHSLVSSIPRFFWCSENFWFIEIDRYVFEDV